jgi:hypothetical protein
MDLLLLAKYGDVARFWEVHFKRAFHCLDYQKKSFSCFCRQVSSVPLEGFFDKLKLFGNILSYE